MNQTQLIQIGKQNPKRNFIIILYINAYAEGITGRNISNLVLTGPNDGGFANKKEAEDFINAEKKLGKYKSKETQANRGYGRLGDFYSPNFIKGINMEKFLADNLYSNCGYRQII